MSSAPPSAENSASYLRAVETFYDDVARNPEAGLCCVGGGGLALPGLRVPAAMEQMSYGCGSSVDPAGLAGEPTVAYVGVGGGKEALQFAYFSRKPGGVIAVEPVASMREAARRNLAEAAAENPWFDPSFVDIRSGDAFALPLEDGSIDVVAQNCLFNVFAPDELARALREARRVLRDGGALSMSDPVASEPLPARLQNDLRLRAMCLSGALPFDEYVACVIAAGFGQVEIRRRRPYRVLDPSTYGLDAPLLLESVDLVAYAVPVPADGPCVFTGRTATYVGREVRLDDGNGHLLERGIPANVCDKTAGALALRADVVVTASTWHYDGGGCC